MSDPETLITLTADIVSAMVSNNEVTVDDLPNLITRVHGALSDLGREPEPEPAKQEPAVSVRSSIKPDYLVSLESGRKVKMLKRYLMTSYGMTPDDYRRKWNLPSDYPMVAPNYAQQRKDLAHKIGLGQKGRAARAAAAGKTGAKAPPPIAGKPIAAKEGAPAKPRRRRTRQNEPS